MKVVYFGQKPLGESIFNVLRQDNYFEILGVVTNSNMDNWWRTREIYDWSIQNIETTSVFSNSKPLTESETNSILKIDFDLILSIQHGWKIPNSIVEKSKLAVNLHMSPLPDLRGHHPFFHAIYENRQHFGVTIHELAPEFDTGDIILQNTFNIESNETAYSLYHKSVISSLDLFAEFVAKLKKNEIQRLKQERSTKFYSKSLLSKIENSSNILDFQSQKRLSRSLFFPPITNPESDSVM
jgi:methionyl-tRNA formyltransferase